MVLFILIVRLLVKLDNILIKKNGDGYDVRLSDFGNSIFKSEINYDSDYCCFYYRPPEVILRVKDYNPFKIDIWSLGCVISEIITGDPIFQGNSESELLNCIILKIGSFPKKYILNLELKALNVNITHTQKEYLKELNNNKKQFKDINYDMLKEVLKNMLIIDNNKRYCSKKILRSKLFEPFI